ncbi:MAG: hypothetical protein JWM10_524 [Myxococcaceae bacterium]|nr:hypothetical protein [Myxococcaceae bacterium]
MTMTHDDDATTLRDARRRYFDANGFGDGGYDDAWVRFRVGPIPMAFPNAASRVRAVRFHDLHHLVTGYPTTNRGESEIGAWELASGCADHHAAWVLNLGAMSLGLLAWPASTFRAFVRGRHSRNLYREHFSDALLDRPVGEVRRSLGLDEAPTRPTATDVGVFVAAGALGVLVAPPMGVGMLALGLASAVAARAVPQPAT